MLFKIIRFYYYYFITITSIKHIKLPSRILVFTLELILLYCTDPKIVRLG